jgi:hypothetical protein
LFRYPVIPSLAKKEVAYRDGCDDACQVGQQSAADGMTGVLDAYRTKIYSQDIEGSIR